MGDNFVFIGAGSEEKISTSIIHHTRATLLERGDVFGKIMRKDPDLPGQNLFNVKVVDQEL